VIQTAIWTRIRKLKPLDNWVQTCTIIAEK
jgi:hypothetical protein